MSGSASGSDRLGLLADEFIRRYRRGERPTPTEYAAAHPDLAEQIRDLFPALLMLEDVRPEARAAADGPPERLGEYRIVREIGRGGPRRARDALAEHLRTAERGGNPG
jgi:hypothetical protein